MAAALTITATQTRIGATLALTGATASTNYLFVVTYPSGAIETIEAETNGSGAVTVTVVPNDPGTLSCTVTTVPSNSTEVSAVTATVAP